MGRKKGSTTEAVDIRRQLISEVLFDKPYDELLKEYINLRKSLNLSMENVATLAHTTRQAISFLERGETHSYPLVFLCYIVTWRYKDHVLSRDFSSI